MHVLLHDLSKSCKYERDGCRASKADVPRVCYQSQRGYAANNTLEKDLQHVLL